MPSLSFSHTLQGEGGGGRREGGGREEGGGEVGGERERRQYCVVNHNNKLGKISIYLSG